MSDLHAQSQISFNIDRHADTIRDGYLAASLKVKGDLFIDHDLQGGDRLQVVVSDADGNVIAQSVAVVATPHMKDVKEKGFVIGQERVHSAELSQG